MFSTTEHGRKTMIYVSDRVGGRTRRCMHGIALQRERERNRTRRCMHGIALQREREREK